MTHKSQYYDAVFNIGCGTVHELLGRTRCIEFVKVVDAARIETSAMCLGKVEGFPFRDDDIGGLGNRVHVICSPGPTILLCSLYNLCDYTFHFKNVLAMYWPLGISMLSVLVHCFAGTIYSTWHCNSEHHLSKSRAQILETLVSYMLEQ